jgi:hypothetical protein
LDVKQAIIRAISQATALVDFSKHSSNQIHIMAFEVVLRPVAL